MTIGVAAVVIGGRVTDRFVKRGRVDGPLRVGIIGAAGMLLCASAYPLMPTSALAVAALAAVNFFAAFPWGAASAAIAEIVPASLRAQGAALFFLVLNLVSGIFGPSSVAVVTDYVFRNPNAVRYSLVVVNAIGMTLAIVLLASGLRHYAATVSAATGAEAQRTAA
jgi:MFS family permease